jgi:hypothetical protein
MNSETTTGARLSSCVSQNLPLPAASASITLQRGSALTLAVEQPRALVPADGGHPLALQVVGPLERHRAAVYLARLAASCAAPWTPSPA